MCIRTYRLRSALQWRDDVERSELIKKCLGFDLITQRELDAICAAANMFYKIMGSPLRITNRMGELIPARARITVDIEVTEEEIEHANTKASGFTASVHGD